jgi:hypothetical protein
MDVGGPLLGRGTPVRAGQVVDQRAAGGRSPDGGGVEHVAAGDLGASRGAGPGGRLLAASQGPDRPAAGGEGGDEIAPDEARGTGDEHRPLLLVHSLLAAATGMRVGRRTIPLAMRVAAWGSARRLV